MNLTSSFVLFGSNTSSSKFQEMVVTLISVERMPWKASSVLLNAGSWEKAFLRKGKMKLSSFGVTVAERS